MLYDAFEKKNQQKINQQKIKGPKIVRRLLTKPTFLALIQKPRSSWA